MLVGWVNLYYTWLFGNYNPEATKTTIILTGSQILRLKGAYCKYAPAVTNVPTSLGIRFAEPPSGGKFSLVIIGYCGIVNT